MVEIEKKETADMRLYATDEWFDSDAAANPNISLPDPDEDYMYASARLLSWYPVVNSKGATYEPEDFPKTLLDTLIGKQANLEHDKTRVVGSIFAYDKNADGIDIGIRIDREQADMQGLDPTSLMQGAYFSHVSVELSKDPANSKFYAYDEQFNIKRTYPVLKGRDMGMRRTTANDPYVFQGNRIAERIKPARFTGVGFVPNPADTTAQLYAVAADDTSEERRLAALPASTDAAKHESEDAMSDADKAALEAKLAELETAVRTLKDEKEAASAATASEIETLKAKLASVETELASAVAERDTLKAEKETAAREAAIDALVAELVAIHPVEDTDEAKAALREKAASACGDDGVIRTLKLERTNEALVAKIAALEAKPVEVAAPAAEEKPVEKTEEEKAAAAAAERETFSAGEKPAENFAPTFTAPTESKKGTSDKDLLASF